MSSVAWITLSQKENPDSRIGRIAAFCRQSGVASLAAGAGLCCVPISIAASEIFLTGALVARLAELAHHRCRYHPPRAFWFWLVWAGLETAVWLHSPDISAGAGEMRHLLLTAALFVILPALKGALDYVRVWKGIFATATVGSASVIVDYFRRMAVYHKELAAGGDPSFYLRTGGLLHHWAIFGTVEVLAFAALLEFKAAYPEQRSWVNPALTVQAVAILLSLTRGLWFAAFLVLVLHLVWRRSKVAWRRSEAMWLLLLVPAIAISLSLGPVRHRFDQTFQSDYYSNAERVQMVRVGWRMIREHPLFGVGPGRTEALYSRYLAPGEPIPAYHGHLHNNVLQLAAQFGVFVVVAAAIFVLVLLWDLGRACKRTVDRDRRFLCRTGLLAVIGFLLMGIVDYTYGHSLGLILLAFAVVPPLIEI